jgi:hypothetical protein
VSRCCWRLSARWAGRPRWPDTRCPLSVARNEYAGFSSTLDGERVCTESWSFSKARPFRWRKQEKALTDESSARITSWSGSRSGCSASLLPGLVDLGAEAVVLNHIMVRRNRSLTNRSRIQDEDKLLPVVRTLDLNAWSLHAISNLSVSPSSAFWRQFRLRQGSITRQAGSQKIWQGRVSTITIEAAVHNFKRRRS